MFQKIKVSLLSLLAVITFATPLVVAPIALAQGGPGSSTGPSSGQPDLANSLCNGANTLQLSNSGGNACQDISTGSDNATGRVNQIITDVINIFSVIVGVIAVIMIVIGGFRYITSGGQAEKVTSAKNTILYAIVGLIIVALAQIIVKFVLTKATNNA